MENSPTSLNPAPSLKQMDSIFSNPTWLAIIGVVTTIATGFWQLHANRQLEREKLRSSLVQEASKSGIPETTLKNLQFLVKAGLLEDDKGQIANLKLEDVPAFDVPTNMSPRTRDLIDEFGDPGLRVPRVNSQGIGFAVPDENWVRQNLIEIDVPELKGVPGFPDSGRIRFHRKAAPHFQAVMREIASKGLLNRILSYDGAWAPRVNRGTTSSYSTHAFGIAIDINTKFNALGQPPPPKGQMGSNAELVEIFARHNFHWGGNFSPPDGGHFQFGVKTPRINLPAPTASSASQ